MQRASQPDHLNSTETVSGLADLRPSFGRGLSSGFGLIALFCLAFGLVSCGDSGPGEVPAPLTTQNLPDPNPGNNTDNQGVSEQKLSWQQCAQKFLDDYQVELDPATQAKYTYEDCRNSYTTIKQLVDTGELDAVTYKKIIVSDRFEYRRPGDALVVPLGADLTAMRDYFDQNTKRLEFERNIEGVPVEFKGVSEDPWFVSQVLDQLKLVETELQGRASKNHLSRIVIGDIPNEYRTIEQMVLINADWMLQEEGYLSSLLECIDLKIGLAAKLSGLAVTNRSVDLSMHGYVNGLRLIKKEASSLALIQAKLSEILVVNPPAGEKQAFDYNGKNQVMKLFSSSTVGQFKGQLRDEFTEIGSDQ